MTEKETHKLYELGYQIVPTVSQAEVESVVRALVEYVEGNGGSVKGGEFPSMMDLAYPITQKIETAKKTFKNAYFGWFNFEASADAIAKIQAELKKDTNVLRFLLIIKKHDDTPEGDMFAQKKAVKKQEVSEDEDIVDEVDEEKLDEAIDEMVEEDEA